MNPTMRHPLRLASLGLLIGAGATSAIAQSDRRPTTVELATQYAAAKDALLAEAAERARQLDEAAARTREEYHGCKSPHPPQRRVKRTSAADYEYPATERRLGHEGKVTLCLEIGTDGSLLRAGVIGSSHWERLDAAALAAVRGWSFAPATDESGAAITDVAGVALNFRLQTDVPASSTQ